MHKRLFFRMRSLLAAGGAVTHEGKTPFVIYPKAQRPRRLVIQGRCETADGTLRCVGVYNRTSKRYTIPLVYTSPEGKRTDASVTLDRPLYGVEGHACDELNVTAGRLTVRTECINLSEVTDKLIQYGTYQGRLIYGYKLPEDAYASKVRDACASAFFTVYNASNLVGTAMFGCSISTPGNTLLFTLDAQTNTLEDAKAYLKNKDARIVYVRAEEKVLRYRTLATRLLSPACQIGLDGCPETTVSVTYQPIGEEV